MRSMWKKCGRCQVLKMSSEFPIRGFRNPCPHTYCFPCQREYSREHYRKFGYLHNKRRHQNRQRYITRDQHFVDEYLRAHPCVDCGESDSVVLEFDHVRLEKLHNVSEMAMRGYPLSAIVAEIAKCEVRCANCHRRRTARRFSRKRQSIGEGRAVAQFGRALGLGPRGIAGSNPVRPIFSVQGEEWKTQPTLPIIDSMRP